MKDKEKRAARRKPTYATRLDKQAPRGISVLHFSICNQYFALILCGGNQPDFEHNPRAYVARFELGQ